jgi:hypothetical protein
MVFLNYQFHSSNTKHDKSSCWEDLALHQWTEEELAVLLDEEIERDPTEEELRLLVPGHQERILAGVLARIPGHDE